jgi:monovalent cation/proton antiporter MnhG/PhaG subunit
VTATIRSAAEGGLLTLGVAAQLLSCLGVLAVRDAFDRLHYFSAASTVGPALIAAAVVVQAKLSATGVKALLIVAVSLSTGPVLTHAVARAARIRRFGDSKPRPGERVGGT